MKFRFIYKPLKLLAFPIGLIVMVLVREEIPLVLSTSIIGASSLCILLIIVTAYRESRENQYSEKKDGNEAREWAIFFSNSLNPYLSFLKDYAPTKKSEFKRLYSKAKPQYPSSKEFKETMEGIRLVSDQAIARRKLLKSAEGLHDNTNRVTVECLAATYALRKIFKKNRRWYPLPFPSNKRKVARLLAEAALECDDKINTIIEGIGDLDS